MGHITRFQELKVTRVQFTYDDAFVEFLPPTTTEIPQAKLAIDKLSMSCKLLVFKWRLSSESLLAHVISSFFPSIYIVEHLYLSYERPSFLPHVQRKEDDNDENVLWLDIFRPFTMVKNLSLSKTISLIRPIFQHYSTCFLYTRIHPKCAGSRLQTEILKKKKEELVLSA